MELRRTLAARPERLEQRWSSAEAISPQQCCIECIRHDQATGASHAQRRQ
jgi:hypothetical protein